MTSLCKVSFSLDPIRSLHAHWKNEFYPALLSNKGMLIKDELNLSVLTFQATLEAQNKESQHPTSEEGILVSNLRELIHLLENRTTIDNSKLITINECFKKTLNLHSLATDRDSKERSATIGSPAKKVPNPNHLLNKAIRKDLRNHHYEAAFKKIFEHPDRTTAVDFIAQVPESAFNELISLYIEAKEFDMACRLALALPYNEHWGIRWACGLWIDLALSLIENGKCESAQEMIEKVPDKEDREKLQLQFNKKLMLVPSIGPPTSPAPPLPPIAANVESETEADEKMQMDELVKALSHKDIDYRRQDLCNLFDGMVETADNSLISYIRKECLPKNDLTQAWKAQQMIQNKLFAEQQKKFIEQHVIQRL